MCVNEITNSPILTLILQIYKFTVRVTIIGRECMQKKCMLSFISAQSWPSDGDYDRGGYTTCISR